MKSSITKKISRIFLLSLMLIFFRPHAHALVFNTDTFNFRSYSEEESEDDPVAELLLTGLILGLITTAAGYYYFNTVQFQDFPYQPYGDGNYVVRGTIEEFLYTDAGRNRNRFSLGTSLVYLNELGIGNESTFEGLFFPYFGPYFENLALYSREGFCDNIKLGGQLSLLQTNLLSINFLALYTSWFGQGMEDFRNGYGLGLVLRSYPIKPLVVEWKFNFQNYSHDFEVFESNLQAGFMLSRYEFFAAWKVLSFSNTSKNNACHFGNFHGFTIGTRVYFSL